MIVENKYYTDKINSLLEDKDIFEIIQEYLNKIIIEKENQKELNDQILQVYFHSK